MAKIMTTGAAAAAGMNAATIAGGAPRAPESAGEKVVVACKLPMGLRLRNFRPRNVPYQQRDGSVKEVVEHVPDQTSIVIHGSSPPRVGNSRHRIMYGYGFTEGVDKESYDDWAKANKDQPFLINHLVFSSASIAEAEEKAKDYEKQPTGMERLNPDGDRRFLTGIETANKD